MSNQKQFHVLRPLLRHVVPPNPGKYRLLMYVVKERWASGQVFECEKGISATLEHVYNKPENLVESDTVHFDIHGR